MSPSDGTTTTTVEAITDNGGLSGDDYFANSLSLNLNSLMNDESPLFPSTTAEKETSGTTGSGKSTPTDSNPNSESEEAKLLRRKSPPPGFGAPPGL